MEKERHALLLFFVRLRSPTIFGAAALFSCGGADILWGFEKVKLLSRFAQQANDLAWIAGGKYIGWYVFRNYAAGTNHAAVTN
jgi:hypothetical protein